MIENLAPAGRSKDDPADAIPDSRTKPQVTASATSGLWTATESLRRCMHST